MLKLSPESRDGNGSGETRGKELHAVAKFSGLMILRTSRHNIEHLLHTDMVLNSLHHFRAKP